MPGVGIEPYDPTFFWSPCREPLNVSSIRYQENLALFDELKLSVSLDQFNNRSILDAYENCSGLVNDFEQILADEINNQIWENMNYCYDQVFFSGAQDTFNGELGIMSVGILNENAVETTTGPIEDDSFDSNNQVEDVDEADVVKSDGVYVYTIYGSEIIVLDLLGNELSRLDLFPGRKTETTNTGTEISPVFIGEINALTSLRSILLDIAKDFFSTLSSLFPIIRPWLPPILTNDFSSSFGHFFSSPIRGLFVHNETLTAIISERGYSTKTEVVLMDMDDGKLSISQRKTFNGKYKTARKIGSIVHLISVSSVPSVRYNDITAKLRRNNDNLTELNDSEYAKAAFEIAISEIPSLAEDLVTNLLSQQQGTSGTSMSSEMSDFLLNDSTCDHIVKISYESQSEDGPTTTSIRYHRGFLQVISFDIQSGLNETNLAGVFVPNIYPDVYASKDMLFIGGTSYASFSTTNATDEIATQVVAFDFQNKSVIPKATGVFPGYTINQFAFDYYEDHLRIATTSRASQFSNSTNRVIVASIQNETIQTIGSLQGLGETEQIFAVRFLGDLAFMVTFRVIDPFYTIDLSSPENPVMRGELKIPGFSNYLHPVGDNYILAVGRDADEFTGMLLGLQVTLFDISDLDNPVQIAKYVVDGWSMGNSQNDHLSFRYLPESRKLILPVSSSSFDGFHIYDINPEFNTEQGEVGISLDFVISHFDEDKLSLSCYSDALLDPRSLVFEGDVMTFKGHNILSHDLNTGGQLFDIELDTDLDTDEICLAWF